MFGRARIELKTDAQLLVMRQAGLVVHDALTAATAAVQPGATTAAVAKAAAEVIESAGASSNFLGYGEPPFPSVACISVNEEVVHGVPGHRILEPGDLVSIDCGAIVDGWHGDAARTIICGGPEAGSPEDLALSQATQDSLWAGIAVLDKARFVSEVGAAVEDSIGGRFEILEGYTGHGIGSRMHMAPEVLNYRVRERGPRIKPGLCIAIEPMCVAGSAEVETAEDGWTVVTRDGSRGAHWEHTVAIHERGIWVLTAPDGGLAGLAPYAVTPVALG